MKYLPLVLLLGVIGYLASKRESMQKQQPRHDDRMSPSWLNENVYEEGKQS